MLHIFSLTFEQFCGNNIIHSRSCNVNLPFFFLLYRNTKSFVRDSEPISASTGVASIVVGVLFKEIDGEAEIAALVVLAFVYELWLEGLMDDLEHHGITKAAGDLLGILVLLRRDGINSLFVIEIKSVFEHCYAVDRMDGLSRGEMLLHVLS